MTAIQRASGRAPSYDGAASHDAPPAAGPEIEHFAGNPGLGLMALRIQSGALHKKDLESRVAQEAQQREELRHEQQEAEAAAREAEESSDRWGTVVMVAKVTAIAASVAAAVLTGGSSLVVAAAIIGGCARAGGVVAEKCGASPGLCTGLEIGGAALTLGAAGAGALAEAGGQAAGQVSEKAAEKAAEKATLATTRAALQATAGGATATQGYGTIRQGRAEGQVLDHNATALEARHQSDEALTHQQNSLDALRRQAAADRQSTATVIQTDQRHAAALTQLLSSMRG
jgi:hypothetical protein